MVALHGSSTEVGTYSDLNVLQEPERVVALQWEAEEEFGYSYGLQKTRLSELCLEATLLYDYGL